VKQISSLLNAMDYEVRSITVPAPYLHIGGAMSIVSPECVLCCRGVFPDDFFDGFDKIEIFRDTFVSGNIMCLGNNEVVADVVNIEAIKELERAEIIVHAINLSEFLKGRGGPSCLIMPVERTRIGQARRRVQ